ncbi:aldehyde dehydrogenase family protein [Aquibium pacificus]|uniref:aldehyde dehydrogenase family protein n=1 Tax=Aquibium pacificus TaxID=3153579 RepID=UPI00349F0C4C
MATGLPQEIGAELCANPTLCKLSFTGTTRVGSLLMAQCAPTVKRLSLELGAMRHSSFWTMRISSPPPAD